MPPARRDNTLDEPSAHLYRQKISVIHDVLVDMTDRQIVCASTINSNEANCKGYSSLCEESVFDILRLYFFCNA